MSPLPQDASHEFGVALKISGDGTCLTGLTWQIWPEAKMKTAGTGFRLSSPFFVICFSFDQRVTGR